MTSAQRYLSFLAVISAVAALSAFTSVWFVRSPAKAPADAHQWLHDQLKLTAAQEKQVEGVERKFLERRAALVSEIRQANQELAAAIRRDGKWSPSVESAIDRGQRAQGELQKLTVQHCLELPSHLSPEQGQQLLELAARALGRDAD